jgi:putative colanic acid biosynthesis UDP-glucose lipid carrier transferase
MMHGKPGPYAPILMTFYRLSDAFLSAGLFLGFSWIFQRYQPGYLVASIIIFFIALISFDAAGLYQSWRGTRLRSEFNRIVLGCAVIYALLLVVSYVLKVSGQFSRLTVLSWMIVLPAFMGLERGLIRRILESYREKGRNIRKAVIAGANESGERLARWIDDNPGLGVQLLGFFDQNLTKPVCGYRVIGSLDSISDYVKKNQIETVYIVLPMHAEESLRMLFRDLADTTCSIHLVPDIFFLDLVQGGRISYFEEIPVISLRETPFLGVNLLIKRVEDLVLASLFLAIVSPLMLLIAAGIKLTSRGPAIFKQWRYGLNGTPIEIYKFRTMTVCEDGYDFQQAKSCDPRVTPLGAFLRKTSLDELPQFLNVIQGRMSIVGPRPHPVAMNEEYRKQIPGYMIRHKVKPGITGLAQVNGWRGETDTLEKIQKRIEHDISYMRQWSLLLDFRIMFQTLLSGSWRTHAY